MARSFPSDGNRCTGHNRDSAKSRCKNYRIAPTTKCRRHGGLSLRGENSPTYRGKGRSKYLPTVLADQYLAALNDPDLLATDKDIALIDLRMNELAAKLDASDMGALWTEAHTALLSMEEAQGRGDVAEMRAQLDVIGQLIKRAANHRFLWHDLIQTAKDLSTLRFAEHRRLVDLRTMMPENQVLQMVGLFLEALRQALTTRVDLQIARAIQADMQARVAKFVPTTRGQGS